MEFGWLPDPEGSDRFARSMPELYGHPGELMAAAPSWQGDGLTGDLMPYLAWYETDIPGWKAKDAEPPYRPQPGNDCTAESTSHGIDLLQCIEIAAGDVPNPPRFDSDDFRCCTEAVYAFGLHAGGMRGDRGCYGHAIVKGILDSGVLPYRDVDGPDDIDATRLSQWAYDPGAVVQKYAPIARKNVMAVATRVKTWTEYCAAIANRQVVLLPSMVGFNTPRDDKGICGQAGRWAHQMFGCGVIRSDGIETGVIAQSWGPNNPRGPRPFRLPSFCFRATRDAFERIFSYEDCWAIGGFSAFERRPLPSRWTNTGWIR